MILQRLPILSRGLGRNTPARRAGYQSSSNKCVPNTDWQGKTMIWCQMICWNPFYTDLERFHFLVSASVYLCKSVHQNSPGHSWRLFTPAYSLVLTIKHTSLWDSAVALTKWGGKWNCLEHSTILHYRCSLEAGIIGSTLSGMLPDNGEHRREPPNWKYRIGQWVKHHRRLSSWALCLIERKILQNIWEDIGSRQMCPFEPVFPTISTK